MRIQHNIMAMNAYRNYNRNTSALSKNLERLSSGYKINRAGDDAAGLAISEKMRAQITGLEAAQKNVKDGISLVNTAEGAMQEVQDMLNRMVYLAQQSANGTYDNEVDRANLQKEVESLKSEINRIADSANFNGIKLLDGSLSKAGVASVESKFDLPDVGAILGTDTVLHKSDARVDNKTSFSVDLHNFKFSNEAGKDLEIKFGDTTIKLAGGTKLDTDPRLADSGAIAATELLTTDGNYTLAGTDLTGITGETLDEQLDQIVDAFNATSGTSGWTVAVNDAKDGFVFEATTAGAINNSGPGATLGGTANVVDGTEPNQFVAGDPTAATVTVTGGGTNDWTDTANITAAAGDVITVNVGGNNYSVTLTANGTTATGNNQFEIPATGGNAAVLAGVLGKVNAQITTANTTAAGGTTTYNEVGTLTLTGNADGTITGAANVTVQTYDTVGTKATATEAFGDKKVSITAGGHTAEVGAGTTKEQLEAFAADFNANSADAANWKASLNDAGDGIKFTSVAKGDAADGVALPAAGTDGEPDEIYAEMDAKKIIDAIKAGKATYSYNGGADTAIAADEMKVIIDNVAFEVTGDGTRLTFTQMDKDETTSSGGNVDGRMDVTVSVGGKPITDGEFGDYNKSTTNITNKGDNASDKRIASTYFDLTKEMVSNGASIKIGDKTYKFVTEGKAGAGDVDLTDLDAESASYLSDVAERLTQAAADNTVWTVGHDGDRVTVTEYVDPTGKNYTELNSTTDADGNTTLNADAFDLSTMDGVAKSLGFASASKEGSEGLTLQIGDSSDSYNQLKVAIGDIHTAALGINDINIGTQAGAQAAVNIVKNAINTVSSIRGDLGAISNRLDHTANNLSVMRENIQDAESAIRDTDIAEEMMSYTKNNILVQSAQAMLAQANQVPQGVLQLLQ